MTVDYSRIWPYAIAGLALLVIYRRLTRTFGRQPLAPARMWLRVGLLTVLGCALAPVALKSGLFFAAVAAGLAAGAALGVWGALHTRYATLDGRLFYVPHTITGVAVSLLLIGRMAYRFAQIFMNGSADANLYTGQGMAVSSMLQSPLTVGLLFTVAGYYVCYNCLVLWRSKRISPEDLEVPPTPTAAS